MGFELPPALLYGFGAMLIILGGLRAYHLGWKRKREEEAVAAEAASEVETEQAEDGPGVDESRRDPGWRRRDGGGYKRHLAWGMLWVGMGLFLIVSTLLKRG